MYFVVSLASRYESSLPICPRAGHSGWPFWLAILAGISLSTPAFAIVTIDYVTVGNAGNTADTVTPNPGYGAVAYEYQIGKYEVTNAQYAEFLNAKGESNSNGIYNSSMASYGITQSGSSGSFSYNVTSGFESKPVVYVSWYDAARFANWLHNGQGIGSMETGAYTLNENTGLITKNPSAEVWLPSEDEWYKAAYFQGDTASYSLYPNGEDSITLADANYSGSGSRDVGTYADDASYYGTYDQGGNVWERNDAVIDSSRGLRGGSWDANETNLRASIRYFYGPSDELDNIGFRVARSSLSAIPEPTSLLSTAGLLSCGLMLRRRGKHSL